MLPAVIRGREFFQPHGLNAPSGAHPRWV